MPWHFTVIRVRPATGMFGSEPLPKTRQAGEVVDIRQGELEENLFTEQLVDFYRYHDGAVLFKDLDSDEAGLELLRLASWEKLHAAITEMYEEFRDECDLEWLDHFVAFAEAPHSGNYFIMPTDGPSAGQVIYCDHDGPTFQAWAPDFHSFLRQFMDDPAEQIYQLVLRQTLI